MLPQWELWACAHHYVTQHGQDAAVMAGMRCDELLKGGDYEDARNFHAIIRRINQLLERASEPLH